MAAINPDQHPRAERLHMPHYGISTEDRGLLDWTWVAERMARSRNYWICSTHPDGRPNATPVWGVWLDGALYFGCSRKSRKALNFASNPEVTMHLESGDEAVIFEGTVAEVSDMPLLERLAAAYSAKYPSFTPDPADLSSADRMTYTVEARLVMAWLESDYPNTATRWRFPAGG